MKKKVRPTHIINIVVFFLILFTCAIALIVIKRPEISEIEQRKLAEKPELTIETLFNGTYFSDLNAYYNDTVPYRDELKRISTKIRGYSGIAVNNAEVHGNLSYVELETVTETPDIPEEPQEVENDSAEVTTTPQENHESEQNAQTTEETSKTTITEANTQYEIAEGVYTNGQIVVLQDGHWRGISMFGGGTGKNYAEYVNAFQQEIGDAAQVYSMVIPTSGAFYTPSNFIQYNASQFKSILSIHQLLHPSVTDVDVYSALADKLDDPIYTRTDHHWQPLAAYYAAETFAETAGVPFAPLSSYEKVDIDGYIGTMYSFTESANLLADPETFTYYMPTNSYTTAYYTIDDVFEYEASLFVKQPVSQSYSTFMGGDAKIVKIKTDVNNGRKLALFKDSYGNAEVPFLTSSFEEIHVIDIRYFTPNAVRYIENYEITDVLFSMCIFSSVGPNAEQINTIRTQTP